MSTVRAEAIAMMIDLTGLPDEVIARVVGIVDDARRTDVKAAGVPVAEQDENGRTPLRGRFAHTATGSWSAEQFEEARREMMQSTEKKWAAMYGEYRVEPS